MSDERRPPQILRPARWSTARSPRLRMDWGALSRPGAGREVNPDCFYLGRFDRTLEPVLTSMSEADTWWHHVNGYVALVGDGLDNGPVGEVASRTALRTLLDLTLETPDWIMRYDDPSLVDRVSSRIIDRLRVVNELLMTLGETSGPSSSLGASVTIVALLPPYGLVAHVGGSRAYLSRRGSLVRLTRDHTSAQMLADAGLIDERDAATHPARHVVTRAVGLSGSPLFSVDVERFEVAAGDSVVLCTDGLAEVVTDQEIADLVDSPGSAAVACSSIVDRALARDARDSVTVVVGRL